MAFFIRNPVSIIGNFKALWQPPLLASEWGAIPVEDLTRGKTVTGGQLGLKPEPFGSRISEVTETTSNNQDGFTYQEAQEIISGHEDRGMPSGTDWDGIYDYLSSQHKAYANPLAEALMTVWRDDAEQPGFNQPSGNLVGLVERFTGERVWERADE